ncbi:MAG: tryptophan 7-halogenase [Vicingaceae bacterium]
MSFKSIGIVGGGTSGYLTALTLSKLVPHKRISIIESSKIPVIGVGESTTPKLLRMLHEVLEFDLAEFYAEVKPTWKLGVQYYWGNKEKEFYNNALGYINPFLSHEVKQDINYNSLNSVLMNHNKSFIIETSDEKKPYRSLAIPHSYAYHLDNQLLVKYLQKKIKAAGIDIIDAKIKDTIRKENGDIKSLISEENQEYNFDFFVDCSGFSSILLEKTMKVPFKDFKSSLFTDTAITASDDHCGVIKPYTEARTMNNGWQWTIPMQSTDHLGYVFSSSFSSEEDAEKEFRTLNPRIEDTKTIRFRSGRHTDFIKGNIAAIGNSYGFIEALQSTALHMVITNIYALVLHLKNLEKEKDYGSIINENLGEIWDRLRWFIAIQFKFNSRLDSEFWKCCRAEVDISGAEELLELYHSVGPLYTLKGKNEAVNKLDQFQIYGLFSHDFLLLIQGIYPQKPPFKISSDERKSWLKKYKLWDQIALKSLPQHEVLQKISENPEILEFEKFFDSPFLLDREFDFLNKVNIADFIIKC